eukprot:m.326661 g.326661  ORF g.326661 m.326661 type:complete len:311 (+) comp19743_c1_seq3:50-982(+)
MVRSKSPYTRVSVQSGSTSLGDDRTARHDFHNLGDSLTLLRYCSRCHRLVLLSAIPATRWIDTRNLHVGARERFRTMLWGSDNDNDHDAGDAGTGSDEGHPSESDGDDSYDGEEPAATSTEPLPTGAAYGTFAWPSAAELARWVTAQPSDMFADGRRVIELGAGTGLPGLAAACRGAHVTLTDIDDPEVISTCQQAYRRRASAVAKAGGTVTVHPLLWGQVTPWLVSLPPQHLVLAADCWYDSRDFEDVMATVVFLMQRNPRAKMIAAYHRRSAGRSFQYLFLKWGLSCRVLPWDSEDDIELWELQLQHS